MLPDDPRHGTNAGYQAHHKWKVPTCQPCRTAHAKQHKGFRDRKYIQRLDSLLVDPAPTIRRIRALQAIGWTLNDIDQETGGSGSNAIWNVLHQPSVHVDTAAKFAALYDRLHMTPGPSNRTRGLAVRRGWLPPLAYDDIETGAVDTHAVTMINRDDTEDVDPVVVLRILDGDMTLAPTATKAERIDIVARWSGSLNELERLTGWEPRRYKNRSAA